jgi:hypothetical protein
MTQTTSTTSAPNSVLYCANHPSIETTLRCNNCLKPICPKCAVLTPTGYRCKECVRSQQKVFETAEPQDFLFAALIPAPLAFIGSLAQLLPLGLFFSIIIIAFLAPAMGVLIAETVRRAVRRRRSNRLFYIAAISAAVGAVPVLLFALVRFNLLPILLGGYYIITVAPAVFYRLKGIRVN